MSSDVFSVHSLCLLCLRGYTRLNRSTTETLTTGPQRMHREESRRRF